MTSRRASKRRSDSPAKRSGGVAPAPVTVEERAVLEEMAAGYPFEGAVFFTLPGCDAPEHRRHIHALMLGMLGGHPSVAAGFSRMCCGCALLVLDQTSVKRL